MFHEIRDESSEIETRRDFDPNFRDKSKLARVETRFRHSRDLEKIQLFDGEKIVVPISYFYELKIIEL